ncbi:MAG: AMP-binding protein [Propionibacteriaceae bacterium]|nr:AMP-binding protein [Propionibacteriaceae bacterium]
MHTALDDGPKFQHLLDDIFEEVRMLSSGVTRRPSLLHEIVDATAAEYPDNIAVRTEAQEITYAQLKSMSGSLARHLHDLGVRRGDRVVIIVENSIPVPVTAIAASRIGAIFAVLDPMIKSFSLQPVLDDCSPMAVVTTDILAEQHGLRPRFNVVTVDGDYEDALTKEVWSEPCPAISIDPMGLFFTSGTTSHVKAIVSPHDRVLFSTRAIQRRLGYRTGDVVGSFLPMSFDYGFYQFILAASVGATLAMGRPNDPSVTFVRKLREWGSTIFPMTPSLAYVIVRIASRELSALPPLRMVTNTGSHLPAAHIAKLRELFSGLRVYVMFGLTECKRVSILDSDELDRRPTSVGRPLDDTECLIVDPSGNVLPPGEVGELVVRGPHVMSGYWRAPDETAKRFRQRGPGTEIALHTGDLASLDDEGYLYFHGRHDDIFKQHGYRVSASEIEHAALDVYGVTGAAVLPPTVKRGAVLLVTGDITESAMFDGLRERLEHYRVPETIRIVAELPRTQRGKINKNALSRDFDLVLMDDMDAT